MRRLATLLLTGLLLPFGTGAFVTLDNSESTPTPLPTATPDPKPQSPPSPPVATPIRPVEPEALRHVAVTGPPLRSVLFLTGSDQRVYADLGLLKALRQFHLAPDLVVVEGAAALPALAYALGYPMGYLDSLLRATPLEDYLNESDNPVPVRPGSGKAVDPRWDRPDAMPWYMDLATGKMALPSWVQEQLNSTACRGYPQLAWLVAKLIREAPRRDTVPAAFQTPLAFQMVDARTGVPLLVRPGNLQALVKASMVPAANAIPCQPAPLWLNGEIASGGLPLWEHWPIAPAHLIHLELSPLLTPHPLMGLGTTVLDSLRSHWNRTLVPIPGGPAPFSLLLENESDLPSEDSVATWVEMGYRAGLRSLDALRSVLNADSTAPMPVRKTEGEDRLWANASVDPDGSGNFQLLRQRLRLLTREGQPESWISGLQQGGFYSGFDVEWQPSPREGQDESLLLRAHENSRLSVQGAAAYQVLGQPLVRHYPQAMVISEWAEPHYLPFELQGALLAGGSHPGWGGQFRLEPTWIWWLRLSVFEMSQVHRLLPPTREWQRAGADTLFLREGIGGLRIALGPSPRQSLTGEVRRRSLLNLNAPPEAFDNGYGSVDFRVKLHWRTADESPYALRGRVDIVSAYSDPTEVSGPLRETYSSHAGDFELGWRNWETFGGAHWADRGDPVDADIYQLWITGSENPLSFSREIWVPGWQHLRFARMGGGWNYSWRAFGFRLRGGALSYLQSEPDGPERTQSLPFWEGGISVATPLGPWRLSAGGFDREGPFLALQWGYNLDLESLFEDSER